MKWLNVLTILVTLACYSSPFIKPSEFWPLSIVGLFYPVLLLVNLAFVLYWAVQFKQWFLFSLVTILLGFSHLKGIIGTSGFFPNPPLPSSTSTDTIHITTYNCRSFKVPNGSIGDLERMWKSIDKKFSPDILCLQEGYDPNYRKKRKKSILFNDFLKTNGLKHLKRSGKLMVFSKYPISKIKWHQPDNSYHGYLVVDVKTPQKTLRIINTHLLSNDVTDLASELKQSPDLEKKKAFKKLKQMLSHYKRAAIKRMIQAESIARLVDNSPHPTIVCGDFNDVPQSYNYQVIAKRLTDSFIKAGTGLGITYAGDIPGLRIDYILTSKELNVIETKVENQIKISDHYPVSATIQL